MTQITYMSSSPFLTLLFHFIQCIELEVRGEIRENRTIQVALFERNFDIFFLRLTTKKILSTMYFFPFPLFSVLFKIVCSNYLITYKVNTYSVVAYYQLNKTKSSKTLFGSRSQSECSITKAQQGGKEINHHIRIYTK